MRRVGAILLVLGAIGACRQAPPVRQFALVGQVVAVTPERNEITIKHEDIPNFMPGMTMPFKVRDAAIIRDRVPGDLVTATLVVGEVEAYLSTLSKTGFAEVTEPPPAPVAEGREAGGHGGRRGVPGSGRHGAASGGLAWPPGGVDLSSTRAVPCPSSVR